VSNVFFREFAIYEKVSGNKRLGFSQSVQKLKKVSPPIAADFLFGRDWNMPMTHIIHRKALARGPKGRKLSVAVQSFSHVGEGFDLNL